MYIYGRERSRTSELEQSKGLGSFCGYWRLWIVCISDACTQTGKTLCQNTLLSAFFAEEEVEEINGNSEKKKRNINFIPIFSLQLKELDVTEFLTSLTKLDVT